MKSLRFLAVAALFLTLAPVLEAADFGVRAGRTSESDEEFVGAELRFDLGAISLNPNLEYSLDDEVTAGTANLDATFDIINIGRVTPYAGAGIGLRYVDRDVGESATDIVGNLIGGIALRLDFLEPYAQVKYFRLLDDDEGDADDDIALIIGLRF